MPPAPRTHCTRGHELTGENLWIGRRTDGRTYPYRRCKTCKWMTQRERRGFDMRVSNEGLREAFLRSDITHGEVARRLGWMRGTHADGRKVAHRLGLKSTVKRHNGRVYRHFTKTIHIGEAEMIMRAIGADPVDVGL